MDKRKSVLILETDRAFALRLAKALKDLGPVQVSLTPAVREAALHLVQRPQDLAFIPVAADDQIVRSLRAVQPDIRLILMTPTPDVAVPDFYSGQVQAVLIKSLLAVDLPAVLKQAGAQPFHNPGSKTQTNHTTSAPDTAVLLAALQQAQLGQLLQTVIFAQATQVLAHWGTLNDTEVANVALHTGREWLQDGFKSRVQFLHLPPRTGEWLLYTVCVDDAYLLTMVAASEMPLAELRRQAGQLIGYLLDALQGVAPFAAAETAVDEEDPDRKSYAIVWRPLVKLPPALHIPLRRALERLATVNGCRLRHTAVQPELVHLVVACPPGRDSAWAAYLFKNGAEEIIQQEYGVAANLWETGYYASESAEPLTEAELNIFLERDA